MIIRTYRCQDCEQVWDVTLESGDAPDPECPNCKDVVLTWQPRKFAIGGSITSAAVDVTQKILEDDYGQSNMQDSMREGDAAFKAPVKQGAEREAEERVIREFAAAQTPQMHPAAAGFFPGSPGGPPANIVQAALADAKQHKGRDPVSLLHQAGQRGELAIPFNPLFKG